MDPPPAPPRFGLFYKKKNWLVFFFSKWTIAKSLYLVLLYQFTFAHNRPKSDISGALGPIHYITLKAFAMALGDRTKCKTKNFFSSHGRFSLRRNTSPGDFFKTFSAILAILDGKKLSFSQNPLTSQGLANDSLIKYHIFDCLTLIWPLDNFPV